MIFSLTSFCFAMEYQPEHNPDEDFSTHYGDHESIDEILAQKELTKEIAFYEEYEGKKSAIVIYVPTYFINGEHLQQGINLKRLIHNEYVREFIIREFKRNENPIDTIIRERNNTKTLMQKNPITALVLAALYGAATVGTFWHLTTSQHFVNSSLPIKMFKIALTTSFCMVSGKNMISGLLTF